ncbi:MAG: 2-iminoacetate synthase ThiH [Candidatus Omnitrophota bacterium]
MSFFGVCEYYEGFDAEGFFAGVTGPGVEKALGAPVVSEEQFLSLLSPAAGEYLEEMAVRAHRATLRDFGRTVQLYTPMYLSNYCVNRCVYCGFNPAHNIGRKKLGPAEVEKEAAFIAATGLRHILVLTGESREESPVEYIADCVRILRKSFSSVSIEVYALTGDEYETLINAGVDGLTIYHEVYDREVYDRVHVAGPKKDYRFRLDAPERALEKKMRSVNVGALFGLNRWEKEAFLLGLHAKYLQDKYPDAEISASVPRIRPQAGAFEPEFIVSDRDIVQIILALRIFMPRLGITVSTRENMKFREDLIPLGVTRMSAGSTTVVGGHTLAGSGPGAGAEQFEISDTRSVEEIKNMLRAKGYQPVMKDWMGI